MARTTTEGLREVLDALERVGVDGSLEDGLLVVDGVALPVEVAELAVVTPMSARGLGAPEDGRVGIVLADRVSEDARRELVDQGWGWIDRRGNLRLWTPGLRIASDFAPLRVQAPAERFASIFPPVGVEIALALLEAPERTWSVKDLASATHRSAGGVSERLRALRGAGLVDRQNRPMIPELFWELVPVWHERPTAIATFPGLHGPFDQLSWLGLPEGWVLTDTQAALLLGAPVIASSAGPPDFYLPEPATVAAAVAHFGAAHDQPAATVRSSRYTGIRPAEPFQRTASGIQIAHPVIVALDLAHDRARGREMVEQWDPSPLGVTRVW